MTNKTSSSKKQIGFSILTLLFFLLFLAIGLGSFYHVDQGERAVVLRNGKLKNVGEPGLGFKTPMLDSVRFISVRDHNVTIPLEAYSFDQQPASMRVSVTYRVPADRVGDLYSDYSTLENLQSRVIERRTPDSVKNVFGGFTAVRAIQEREKLGAETLQAVTAAMRDAPVQIIGVQVEEVRFSKVYEQSIEQRMLGPRYRPMYKSKPRVNRSQQRFRPTLRARPGRG